MLTFKVQDMTCGHCVKTITAAVVRVDADAVLEFDLAARQVRVEPQTASAEALRDAMASAGYTAELSTAALTAEARSPASAPRKCCCG
jgi:copper chaperone